MASIAVLVGSPSSPSRTAFAASYMSEVLAREGHAVESIVLRDLPAEDLVRAHVTAPAIASALAMVERAQGVVVATPIYKASFSGLLKTFLDLLPQFGLRGKDVLPLATSGGSAHVLAMDYGLRPVLMSLEPAHIEPSWVVFEAGIPKDAGGGYSLTPEAKAKLDEVAERFSRHLRRPA